MGCRDASGGTFLSERILGAGKKKEKDTGIYAISSAWKFDGSSTEKIMENL